jgi:phenylacetate-CoA ligase
MCSSEVLTAESRRRIHEAFAVEPFNVYAATEPAGIASECERHRMHLYEDLVITELVDDRNRPVPTGIAGAKVLVTVLFSRTQPLIRYEMSDTISLSDSSCDCGRGFGLLGTIDGRAEDVVTLPAADGNVVSVHPNVFHHLLDPLPVKQWQVEHTSEGLVVRIVPGHAAIDPSGLIAALTRELQAAGAMLVPIRVELIDAIAKTPLGKARFVKAPRQGESTDHAGPR